MQTKKYRSGPQTLTEQIQELHNRVRKLETLPRAVATSVNSGTFNVNGGYLGVTGIPPTVPNPVSLPVLTVNGANGFTFDSVFENYFAVSRNTSGPFGSSRALEMADGSGAGTAGFSSIAIYDRQNYSILSDSENVGALGMSDPRIHTTFFDPNAVTNFTSATFTTFRSAFWYMYQPHLRVTLLVNTGAGTVGELALYEATTGTQLVFVSAPANTFAYYDLILDRRLTVNGNGPNGNITNVDVRIRRASGANNVGVTFVEAIGIDLSFGWT